MKKITSKERISYRIDGSTVLELCPEGCLASDEAAKIVAERLGEHVTIEETSIEKAVEDAKASLAPNPRKSRKEK